MWPASCAHPARPRPTFSPWIQRANPQPGWLHDRRGRVDGGRVRNAGGSRAAWRCPRIPASCRHRPANPRADAVQAGGCLMRKTGDRRNVSGAYRFWGIATWGGQSWLQPPFEAAPGSTTKTDLVVAKPRLLPRTKRPPEKAAAARIGCPTSSSPKTDKHPEPRTRCVDCLALKVWPWSIMQSITSLRPNTGRHER